MRGQRTWAVRAFLLKIVLPPLDVLCMKIIGGPYFWQRAPRWFNRLVASSAAAAAVLAVIVGAIAYIAQRRSAALGAGEGYSLSMHVFAMTALGALAVGVAATLIRLGRLELGALVLVGAAAGPMMLIAAPVRASMVNATGTDTSFAWHAAVTTLILGVLSCWTWLAVRCLAERDAVAASSKSPASASLLWAGLLFAVVAVAGLFAYEHIPPQANAPSLVAVAGWSLLAAGVAVVTAYARTARSVGVAVTASAGVLALLVLAYSRDGGWPGVAGWETNGMQSPIVTSVASTAVLLLAPFVGFAVGTVGRALRARIGRVGTRDPAADVAATGARTA